MRHLRRVLVAASALMPALVAAETDFTNLTDSERAAFHAEIRAVLLANPELARPPAPAPIDPYAENVADDLALISSRSGSLFAPDLPGFGADDAEQVIALFTRTGCAACARAEADLRVIADEQPLRVTLIDTDRHADLAQALGLDSVPSYVLPDMIFRGQMPAVVLRRYLSR